MAAAAQNYSGDGFPLHTDDPVALRCLMSDTLFDIREDSGVVAASGAHADTPVPPGTPVTAPLTAETNKTVELTFLGKNGSGVLFVFQDPSTPGQHRLPDQEMEAFEKILTALKLSVDDIALVNIADPGSITLAGLLTFFKPQKTVLLGTQMTLSGIENVSNSPLHQAVSYQKTEFLHTFSFAEMMTDVDKKRQFWNSLKTLLTG